MPGHDLNSESLEWMRVLSQPIWVFDPDTLAILMANDAICDWLGYSRDELESRTITDVRPEKDHVAIRQFVAGFADDARDAGRWEILTGSGETVHASFQWHHAKLDGNSVILATVTDETKLKTLGEEKHLLQETLEDVTRQKEKAARISGVLFERTPCKMLALAPDSFEIVAVTDDYLRATMTRREDLLGQVLFDIFPDDPDDPDADGVKSLRASLKRVKKIQQSDFMGVQRYPIRRPDGAFELRYWVPLNHPVVDADGTLTHILHRVDDVTDLVGEGLFDELDQTGSTAQQHHLFGAASLTSEMRLALSRIDEQEARLRTAERLLGIGRWEWDFERGQAVWSDRVFEIYGSEKRSTAPAFDEYLALVHPDDRDQTLRNYTEFFESGAPQISFSHRVLRDDGDVNYIRGVGERHKTLGKEILVGFVQDVTEDVRKAQSLSQAENLVRIAGEKARVGGWRVDFADRTVHWSGETAIIHGVEPGYQPGYDEAVGFYHEDDRGMVEAAVNSLIEDGLSFDFQARITRADGRLLWVRSVGEPIRDSQGNIIAMQGAFQDIDDLVAARSRAQKVQAELLATLEHIGDAVFTVDENWCFTYVNRLAAKLLKRSRDELIGQGLWDMFPEALGTLFEHEYRRAVETRTVARFRDYFAPLDLWVEVNAYPVPAGLAVYFRDIGGERQKDERLALLETAVSRMNDVLMITEAEPLDGPDGPKIIYVNEAFERRTGYAPEEVIGKTPRILQGPDTDKQEIQRMGALLRQWQPVRTELVNYTKSGEPFWLDLDIVPIKDETGWYTHFVALERDVTEQKESQEKERRAQEVFRLVSQVTNDFVWEYDVVNDRWLRNERHLRMLGLPPEPKAFTLEETVKVVHRDDQQRFLDSFLSALEGGGDEWVLKYRIIDGDGQVRYVENHAAIVRDDDGRATRVVGGLTDVSDIRELDRQFRAAQKMEAIGQLTGGVAHDFNNLLTIILGNAEELSDRLSEDDKLRILAEMTATAAERGSELTHRLLAFARRQPLEPQVLDLNRLISSMDSLLRRTLPESISIEFVRAAGLWKVELDPAQLESAILNLAINARDAMRDGGALTLETANVHLDQDYTDREDGVSPGQYVMISFTDTGIGMDEATREQVFEPFFTTKKVGEGTGLGLSMVFGFTKQSAGHIKIYSEIGEGSTVKLYFPRVFEAGATRVSKMERKTTEGGSETILIVEDEELVRVHLERQLKGLGYSVVSAENGHEALEEIRKPDQHIDLILTDVIMPGGINGRDVAEQAAALIPGIKVLFTSGYTENSIVHQGRLKPGVHLLEKPYRRQVLARKVREVLDE